MIPANFTQRIITIVDSAGTGVKTVEGLRSDDLPAPCVSVHIQSAENFHKEMTDVFRVYAVVRYEEHYADASHTVVKQKFNYILNQFLIDDLTTQMQGFGYHMFKASVDSISSETQNDFFINEFVLECILERETN